ncbi:Predicted regulator of Ras-like GTPase activity, Roadblock/LC7/MglB family [Gammaproteobacteria bacterium]
MREQMLKSILSDLNGASAEIEASAIISADGLTLAALLPQEVDEDRVGAMAAAMLSLGERTAYELARGELEQVMVKGSNGYILMSHIGKDAVLAVIARKDAKLGLIFLDAKRAAKNIADIL